MENVEQHKMSTKQRTNELKTQDYIVETQNLDVTAESKENC